MQSGRGGCCKRGIAVDLEARPIGMRVWLAGGSSYDDVVNVLFSSLFCSPRGSNGKPEFALENHRCVYIMEQL